MAALGVLLALWLAQHTARIAGLDAGKVWNLCVVALFAALVGSRLLLVALNWSELRLHPMWLLGLAMIHHPLLAGLEGWPRWRPRYCMRRWQRLPLWSTADALAAPVALGLAFEQLGALLAGSGYGNRRLAARWAVTYTHLLAPLWSGAPLDVALHPVQAYAALGFVTLSIFLLVWLPYRRQRGRCGGPVVAGGWRGDFCHRVLARHRRTGLVAGRRAGWPQVAAVAMVVVGGL